MATCRKGHEIGEAIREGPRSTKRKLASWRRGRVQSAAGSVSKPLEMPLGDTPSAVSARVRGKLAGSRALAQTSREFFVA